MADQPARGELRLPLNDQLEAALQQVCEQQDLTSLDDAAEWLLRRRLRKGTQGLTGRGRASKRQVQLMVRALLKLDEVPHPDHAADAAVVDRRIVR